MRCHYPARMRKWWQRGRGIQVAVLLGEGLGAEESRGGLPAVVKQGCPPCDSESTRRESRPSDQIDGGEEKRQGFWLWWLTT